MIPCSVCHQIYCSCYSAAIGVAGTSPISGLASFYTNDLRPGTAEAKRVADYVEVTLGTQTFKISVAQADGLRNSLRKAIDG